MKLIPLTQAQIAMVDDEDYDRVSKHCWYVVNSYGLTYARRTIYTPTKLNLYLHNFIIPPPEGFTNDHRDRNGLNCQKENLRFATKSQQSMNRLKPGSLPYRGVALKKNGWTARVRVGEKAYSKCGFETIEEAACAYDELAKKYHGEFAILNFPEAL